MWPESRLPHTPMRMRMCMHLLLQVVRLWKHPDFGEGRFLASKSFYKASEVSLMWSPKGDNLLIHTHTEVDKSGKSYYGETGLFFMSLEGKARTNASTLSQGEQYAGVSE